MFFELIKQTKLKFSRKKNTKNKKFKLARWLYVVLKNKSTQN